MKRRIFLQTSLGLTLAAPLSAAVEMLQLDGITDVLSKAASSGQVRAAALYIRKGDFSFSKSFGAAKSLDAIFLLASISKPISTTAVMNLFDQEKLALDDKVKKFIPEFTGDGRQSITMRQLLTHVSGLPDQLPQNAMLRGRHAKLAEFVAGAIRTPLLFAPGSRYSYSSMAVLLATEVAQRITGTPFPTFLGETVFKPLKMNHSALGMGAFKLEALQQCQVESAATESGAGDPKTKTWDWNSLYWRKLGAPWGGAHGSAADVGRFLNEFLHPSGKALKPATARLMITNHNSPGLRPRGLGFDLGGGTSSALCSEKVFGHTGSTGTLCWADPVHDSICVVLTTLPGRAASPHPRNQTSDRIAKAVNAN
jgi:CubicO group peptidase (beta-lactamase class C family)